MTRPQFIAMLESQGFQHQLHGVWSKFTSDDKGTPECWIVSSLSAMHYPQGKWESDKREIFK